MGYLLLGGFLAVAAAGWRAPASDARFLSRVSLAMAVVIAVQMWWGL
jgi:hypothetical protein